MSDDPRLPAKARRIVVSSQNDILMSVVSAIEISIESSLGKLKFPGDFDDVARAT